MPSTYTRNLGIVKIATGEQAGVWGNTTNSNFDFLDDAIDGIVSIPLGNGTTAYTVSTVDGGDSEGRKKVLQFTGSLTAACTITIAPNDAAKHYIVINATNGDQALVFTQGSGATYRLENGFSNIIYCDGMGTTGGVYGALHNLQVNNLRIGGVVTATAGMNVTGNIAASGNISAGGTLSVTGATTLTSLTCSGAVTCSTTCTVTGALTCSSSLSVAGAFVATGSVQWDLAGTAVAGDMFYRHTNGTMARVAIGSAGQYLRVSGGAPAWQTVDTSLTIGTTPITGSTQGYVLFAWNGVLYHSSSLVFNAANGNFGITGGFSCAAIGCTVLTTSGDITAGSGTLYLTNSGGVASTHMYIQAYQDNFAIVKDAGGGAISIKNAGFEMIRCNATSHLQIYIAGYSKPLIDGMLNDNTGIFSYDGVSGQLVIRYKVPGVGPVNFRIASSGPQ
jgi:hypothetical protein